MSNKKTPPAMFKPFDSYVEHGDIVIITTDFDEEGKRAVQLNTVGIDRAKEIVKDLQDAINSIEKVNRRAADEMKYGNMAWE